MRMQRAGNEEAGRASTANPKPKVEAISAARMKAIFISAKARNEAAANGTHELEPGRAAAWSVAFDDPEGPMGNQPDMAVR